MIFYNFFQCIMYTQLTISIQICNNSKTKISIFLFCSIELFFCIKVRFPEIIGWFIQALSHPNLSYRYCMKGTLYCCLSIYYSNSFRFNERLSIPHLDNLSFHITWNLYLCPFTFFMGTKISRLPKD